MLYLTKGHFRVLTNPSTLPLDELPGANKLIRETAGGAINPAFRSFTQHNFRENLQRLTGRSVGDIAEMEAHHVLPQ